MPLTQLRYMARAPPGGSDDPGTQPTTPAQCIPRALAFLSDHGVMTERKSVRRAVLRDLAALDPALAESAEALAALKVAGLLDSDDVPDPAVPNLVRELRLLMAGLRAAVPRAGAGDPLEELRAMAAGVS
jgi:hypothetical protein